MYEHVQDWPVCTNIGSSLVQTRSLDHEVNSLVVPLNLPSANMVLLWLDYSAITRPHVLIIGTGLTSLTLARALLTHTPALEIQLTLIDKARNPGGRLTSRKYDSGVILETGARVFETPLSQKEGGEGAFGREVEAWEQQGWVREVKREKLKGSSIGPGRWWEGTNGLTKGLVEGLLEEVKASSNGRLNIHYEVMVRGLESGPNTS